MKIFLSFLFCFFLNCSFAQNDKNGGIISGNILNEDSGKPIIAASVIAILMSDTTRKAETILSDKTGGFSFANLVLGMYRITITAAGHAYLNVDSIHLRKERQDFNLTNIRLSLAGQNLAGVIVYAEKPLF